MPDKDNTAEDRRHETDEILSREMRRSFVDHLNYAWRNAANRILKARTFADGVDWLAASPVAGPGMIGFLRRMPGPLGGKEFDWATDAAFLTWLRNGCKRPTNPRDWDVGMQAALTSYYLKDRGGDVEGMKAVRLGYAVAFGRWSCVTPNEADMLRELGFEVPDKERTTPPVVRAGESFAVEFAFPVRGAKGKPPYPVGRGTVMVDRVDPAAASPTWRLPTPTGDALEVVSIDDALYRPLLGPGGWVPLDERSFAEACTGREAWKDTPFLPRSPSPVGIDDWSRTGKDLRAEADVERDCLVRAGRLVSIGGIVHRRTEEPVLTLSRRGPRDAHDFPSDDRMTVGWKVDRLRFDEDQRPMNTPSDGTSRVDSGLRVAPVAGALLREAATLAAESQGGRVEACALPERLFGAPLDTPLAALVKSAGTPKVFVKERSDALEKRLRMAIKQVLANPGPLAGPEPENDRDESTLALGF